MESFQVATFDCYGTLVDWEGGLGAFLYDLARRNGDRDPGPGRLLAERWEAIQFDLIQGDYRGYAEVLRHALRAWVAERGYRWNERDGDALESAMQAWQPFPDTIPALLRTREAGIRLAIVSNTDRHIMEHTLRQLEPVEFDEVVVAEDVRSYKPDSGSLRHALRVCGARADEVLHVAFGFKYDIAPAQTLGMGTAWVNRRGEPPPEGPAAGHEWRDLWGLAALAESTA